MCKVGWNNNYYFSRHVYGKFDFRQLLRNSTISNCTAVSYFLYYYVQCWRVPTSWEIRTRDHTVDSTVVYSTEPTRFVWYSNLFIITIAVILVTHCWLRVLLLNRAKNRKIDEKYIEFCGFRNFASTYWENIIFSS